MEAPPVKLHPARKASFARLPPPGKKIQQSELLFNPRFGGMLIDRDQFGAGHFGEQTNIFGTSAEVTKKPSLPLPERCLLLSTTF